MSDWTTSDAEELYRIRGWSQGYFGVDSRGSVVARPDTTDRAEIDLLEVVQNLRERDIETPVLLRFSDILADRLRTLHGAFQSAIAENQYRGKYAAVYPIKVNQQRPVVEEVLRYGRTYDFGLEVGSKPELLAVMAMTADSNERLVVCNGFKDDGYIEAVALATKLGRPIVPVVENFAELQRIMRFGEKYGIRPRIGVRAKLASRGAGRWSGSAGEKSKFGLFVSEILRMLETLKSEGMEDCLTLLHCHVGSQIQDIHELKEAVGELAHIYVELVRLGAGLKFIDVGGGLGVDYSGSQTNGPSSMNYTPDEYASEVVYRIGSICDQASVEHPTIISESGRAMAAYQSVLVFNVLGTSGERARASEVPGEFVNGVANVAGDDEELPQPLVDLALALESVTIETAVECFHDATLARQQALDLFNLGYLTLEQRGLAERTFWAICGRLSGIFPGGGGHDVPEDLANLDSLLSETYFCNMSMFQSLPDSWAIDQLFPVMPIHRLNERPTHLAVLADITCDSDGKIDRFPDEREVRRTLDLHEFRESEDYYLAAFLVGAYQETLGDLHNLFGDTHVVHIRLHDRGGWWIDEVVRGDTAKEVLGYVQYDAEKLQSSLARECELAIRSGRITIAESRALLRFYDTELNGYTYLRQEKIERVNDRPPTDRPTDRL